MAAEAQPPHPSGDEGEDADSARGDALDERERCERERSDVEREATAFERESSQPAAICQQRADRVQRSPKGKGGQRGRGVVFTQVGDVRQRGRRERQQKRDGNLSTQSRRPVRQPACGDGY